VTRASAERVARGVLATGERLTGERLTWEPGAHASAVAPSRPYYEFGVVGATGVPAGRVRVMLDGGARLRVR
jgi:hypothetical protein